ncbi:MAG TPA: hypothetical protein VHU19_15900 [Pyrinomonadaceae bacterium]|jgi:hypothetical protein|nr:hypothetical protein [Pyrinomonadaceae bacterium]
MKKFLTLSIVALLCAQSAAARQQPAKSTENPSAAQTNRQQPAAQQQRTAPPVSPDLKDYGIEIAPDPRLIVMMAALDAAGWDPTPAGERPSVFRELLRKDQAALDPVLRQRMQDFYQHNALKGDSVTPAEQAARYVSLAYTLGQPPTFEEPQRSDDLPAGVLDVLHFVPLLRDFYRQSGIDGRLNSYVQAHRAAREQLRAPTIEMARIVLAYLNTRPQTTINERTHVTEPAKGKKKNERQLTVTNERDRRFRLVPDLLAAPGAVNFRVVGEDYYAIVPADVDPRLSETRRAYIQFVVDPLVAHFSSAVSAKRADIKQLLEKEHARTGADLSPDVFLAVSRSLVAAADARLEEALRLNVLQFETNERLKKAADQPARDRLTKEAKERQSAIADAAVEQLADAYERGAVLSFHFADQLRGIEGSGFDISNFLPDMIASIGVEREMKRPAEFADAVARARESRRRAQEARAREAREAAPTDERRAALLKSLGDVDNLLRVHNYEEAETRLVALREQYRDEPLIYFALGQAASLSAQEAFDESLQAQRLNAALAHFRQAILLSTHDTDPSVVFRAHLASGRILAHLERRAEAVREFDAVIQGSAPADPWHREAVAEKLKLTGQE